MADDADTTRKEAENAAASAPRGRQGKTPPPADDTAKNAAEPDAVEDDDTFPLTRLLDMQEGPEILRHGWATIVGAFQDEIAAIRKDASVAEQRFTRDAAVKRIETWLEKEVEHDNRVTA
jgi:hypothetical protein